MARSSRLLGSPASELGLLAAHALQSVTGMLDSVETGGESDAASSRLGSGIRWRAECSEAPWLWQRLTAGRARVLGWGVDGSDLIAVITACKERSLNDLERTVLYRIIQAEPYKVISAEIGVPTWRVRNAGVTALESLGIPTRCQAIWLGSALLGEALVPVRILTDGGAATVASEFDSGRTTLVHLSLRRPPGLTDAEHRIALALMSGSSDPEIAASRGTSVRTVANQIRALGTKLRASGRGEVVRAFVTDRIPR